MAKQRYIKDSFWTDPYIQELWQTEKLLFLYLLTNTNCNIAWIYEITERQICFDIWVDKNRLSQALDRLAQDGKIIYTNNWIIIINFIKNQSMNPSVEKWIERVLNTLPDWIKDKLGTGCIQAGTYFTLLNLTLPNSTEILEPDILPKENKQIHFGFDDEIENLIKEYNKQRKKKLEKLTQAGIELFKKKLQKLGGTHKGMIAVLEQSIVNWWEWLFELKSPIIDYEDIETFGREMRKDYEWTKAKVGKQKFFELKSKWIEYNALNNK